MLIDCECNEWCERKIEISTETYDKIRRKRNLFILHHDCQPKPTDIFVVKSENYVVYKDPDNDIRSV